MRKVINFNLSLSLCWLKYILIISGHFVICKVHDLIRIEQVLYVESISFSMFMSIPVAFYDIVSLHKAGQIFIICIFLRAIIPNVFFAGPQQEQEQAFRQGPRHAIEWTSA